MDCPTSARKSRYLTAAVSAVLSLAAASAAQAGPQGGVVTSGNASISTPQSDVTRIDQSSNSAGINWQSFDIGAQERVIFNQPSSTSVALNRIQGQDPSQIYGSLSANGRVFLINPNGIIFGSSARINVGSLVASSLDLDSFDVDAGHYAFGAAAQSGAVVNNGQIIAANGGSVSLLGGSVLNNGLIVANFGTVNLGAGRAATLDFAGDGLVRFKIDAGLLTDTAGSAVDNTGEIVANGGQVLMTATQANDVIARAVNNDGVIRAARVDNSGGRIRLIGAGGEVVNSGTLDASGSGANNTGGEVQVLGDQVSLSSTAVIDVSGTAGGGRAFIGGGFGGADASLLNASQTDVAAGAVIRADSLTSGNAGQVVVWANGTTTFNGDILARAFGSSGNGGRAEVSGREYLSIGGHARLQSAHGTMGTLLLDPGSITITNGPNTAPAAALNTIFDGWLNDQLGDGNVTLRTSLAGNNSPEVLTVDSSAQIIWSGNADLTLEGGDSVQVNGSITNSDSGSLVLSSDGLVSLDAPISLSDGDLTVTALGGVTQTSAVFVGGAAEFTAGAGQSVLLTNVNNTFNGTLDIGAASGNLNNVTIRASSPLHLPSLTIGGNLIARSGGSITQAGALDITGTASFTAGSGGSITLANTGNVFGSTVSLAASTGSLVNVSVYDGGDLDLGALSVSNNLTVNAREITQSGALSVGGTFTATAANGRSITLGNNLNSFGGQVALQSRSGQLASVNIYDSTQLNLGALSVSGNLLAGSGASVIQSGSLAVGGDAGFIAGNGQSITLTNTGNAFGGNVTFLAGTGTLQNVSIYDSGAFDVRGLVITGSLSVNALAISQSGAVRTGVNASFTAANGQNIVVDHVGNSFSGDVNFAARTGSLANVSVYDGGDLDLSALSVTNNLTVNAREITQSGALSVGGTASFTADGGRSVRLGVDTNSFNGNVTLASRTGLLDDVTLHDSTALDLAALTISGDLDVSATQITQSGALRIGGTAHFAANAGQAVSLIDIGNAFVDAVSFSARGAGSLSSVTLLNSIALELGAATVSDAYTATAATGDITQSGGLSVGGLFTATAANGQSITLGNSLNSFGNQVVLQAGSGQLASVTIHDSTQLNLGALAISDDLVASSAADIIQSGSLAVGDKATFTAGNGQSITLIDTGNLFGGDVNFLAGAGTLQDVSIFDTNAFDVRALSIAGSLSVNATSITQSGAAQVGTNASFTADNGQSIVVDNAGNSFGGNVDFAARSGALADVSVRDSTALQLSALTVAGSLTAVSGGSLTQTGALNVGTTSVFNAGNGQSITLGSAGNVFTGDVTLGALSGTLNDVTIRDSTALDLKALTIAGDLNATSNVALTQSGALSVGQDSIFTSAAGQSIAFMEANNVFGGTVRFTSLGPGNLQNVSINNSTALNLAALAIDGTLTVTAQSISQSGALNVGDANFTVANGQSITLGDTSNIFRGAVMLAASSGTLQNVTLADSTTLDLQALALAGNLTVRTAGALTQSGALSVGGAASFTAAAGQFIVLDHANNAFGNTVSFASTGPGALSNVSIADTTALDLQALTVAGNLTVAANSITQSGALNVSANSSFTAAAGQSIVLGDAANSFAGTVTIAASSAGNLQNVTLVDSTALELQALTIAGNLVATSGSALTQSGALSIGGNSLLTAAAGQSITLANAANAFTGAVTFASNGPGTLADVTFRDSTALDLQALTLSGALTVTAGGAITQSGDLNVAGAVTFKTLNDAGASIAVDGINHFGTVSAAVRNGADTANANANIVIAEADGVTLGNVQSAGAVTINSADSISSAVNSGVTAAFLSLVATNDIDVVSVGDMHVADVRGGGTVTLTSTGSILDDNIDGAGSQIVANALLLQATGSIGEASGVGNGMLDLQVASVTANAQGGGLHLDQATGDLNARQLSATGPISLRAAAGSIVDDATDPSVASIVSTAGGVQLRALNNIGTVTDLATRQGEALGVNTNGGSLSAQVTSATGQVNLAIANGSSLTASVGAISAGGSGRLLIQSAGDLVLGSFNGAITGFTQVGISSDGTLTLPDAGTFNTGAGSTLLIRGATDVVRTGRSLDFGAGHLIFESGGAGGNVTLNTAVDSLDASIGNGASLSVVQAAGTLALGTLNASNVSVQAGTIVDDGDLNGVTRITADNAITLHAANGIGTAAGRIDTAGQSVSVIADSGAVFVDHQGDVQLSGNAGAGSIDVTVDGDITVNSTLSASGSLSLAASGAIADANDNTTHITAHDAVLAASQIGSVGNALNVDLTSLSANAANGIYVSAANALQLRAVAGTTVAINAVGALTDDGDAQTRIAATDATLSGVSIGSAADALDTSVTQLSAAASNGGIYIDQAGDVALGTLTAAGVDNDIAVTASGAITDDGDDSTRIAGRGLMLNAASIGAATANGAIDTQVTSLNATGSGGGIYINEADGLQLNAITAAGNDVVLAAGGGFTDDGNDATRVTGANVSLTGAAIGTADNRVDTAANVLTAIASNGGVHIDEADSVTLADVRSSGTGNTVDLRTANNGSITVQNLVTQGGAVTLLAGGTGSLNVTGTLESNNGFVTLTSGDILAVPGLNTGTGTATLHTVNDANVGTITAGVITITSDTGNVHLGTANAGTGTVSITALNGAISDDTATSVTAGQATLTARSIGSADNPLNLAVSDLTATSSAGGVFIRDTLDLNVSSITAAGAVNLTTLGNFTQSGAMTSGGNAISVFARNIDMAPIATTFSDGGNITYVATEDDINLGVLNADTGRVLVIAADNVFNATTTKVDNLTGSMVEIRAGGFAPGSGLIGNNARPVLISTPSGVGRNVFLIVPASNGIQRTTPTIEYPGATANVILLKGYTGTTGALLFDPSTTFTPDTVLLNGESIVPLANGRVAVNTNSLSAAKQALSGGVISRANIDWAAFDPNVSLFGTLDPALRLPADQIDEEVPTASLFPGQR